MLSAIVRDFGCVASSSMIAESSTRWLPLPPREALVPDAVGAVVAFGRLPSAPAVVDAPTVASDCGGRRVAAAVSIAARFVRRSPQAMSKEPRMKAVSRVAMCTWRH
jgi:hypothetical protein